jgi:D-alanyl-D-alanine carboxypeptidase/D-alanyl-D-alanine-endopeptidase (penicillin-binding protein 4)
MRRRWIASACAALACLVLLESATMAGPAATGLDALRSLAGGQDAVLVIDGDGRELVSVNADIPLVPASTLKLLTSLVALHHLGPDYRFPTECYLTPGNQLLIKGYGDPLLVSEEVTAICRALAEQLSTVNGILVDDSYFATPVIIPGVGASREPYDAGNGALSVNFNTVAFRRQAGRIVSDEPQTPLLPLALPAIHASRLAAGRISLPSSHNLAARYAGELFRHFLAAAGVACRGELRVATVTPGRDRLVLRRLSAYPLSEVLARLLAHSNNFIANQLLLAVGAAARGAPATLDKGLAAAREYADSSLQLGPLSLAEGSGISRDNRLTARQLMRLLQAFSPWQHLLRRDGEESYKTGTLNGVNTRVGVITRQHAAPVRYVVMVNTPQRHIDPLLARLRAGLDAP